MGRAPVTVRRNVRWKFVGGALFLELFGLKRNHRPRKTAPKENELLYRDTRKKPKKSKFLILFGPFTASFWRSDGFLSKTLRAKRCFFSPKDFLTPPEHSVWDK